MEEFQKDKIQLRLAMCLTQILKHNRAKTKSDKNLELVDALRQLEASSGISFPILQKISKGNRNPQLSTIISMIENLEMKPSEFFKMFEEYTDKQLLEFQKALDDEKSVREERKKEREEKKKKPRKKG